MKKFLAIVVMSGCAFVGVSFITYVSSYIPPILTFAKNLNLIVYWIIVVGIIIAFFFVIKFLAVLTRTLPEKVSPSVSGRRYQVGAFILFFLSIAAASPEGNRIAAALIMAYAFLVANVMGLLNNQD